MASLLKEQGYATACVGKWHLGLGWETTDGYRFSDRSDETGETVDYRRPVTDGPCDHGFDYFFGIPASLYMVPYVYLENDRVTDPQVRQILPLLTERATAWIDRHAETRSDESFFLYFPLTAPHTPVLPTNNFRAVSAAGNYGDFVAQVDGTVGKIMAALERHGLTENTLIIFTSDNGSTMTPMTDYDPLPNDDLRGRKSSRPD